MTNKVELKRYNNSWFKPGRGAVWRGVWLFVGQPIVGCLLLPFSGLRVQLLRLFGAQIGSGVVIRSGVQIKYPWHLAVGDYCWIGERVWIDNLTTVRIADNVCISQGVYICTGNHDWTDPAFGLLIGSVSLEEGSWAGARSVLLPGTQLGKLSVIAAGSVASGSIPDNEIHSGNPASFLRNRKLRSADALAMAKMRV
jgi:putative colanic acid biosynthesis acetyltransferase WcaF